MQTRFIILTVIVLISASACSRGLPEKSSQNYKDAVSAFYIGLAALQVGDDQRAAVELDKATKLASEEPAAWNNLGVLQIRQKDFESSSKSLEQAQSLAPENPTIFSNLAVLETQRGNFEKAIEFLTKAIELDPKDTKSIYTLAKERERQNDDAAAQSLYETILREHEGNLAIQLEIARLAAKRDDSETLKNIITELDPKIEKSGADAKEQFSALQTAVAADDLKQASTQVTYIRNVLLRQPEFRAAIAEFQPSDTSLGKLILKPLKLPTPDFSPAEPDLALTFIAQPVANVKANFAKAIYFNGEDPPVIAWSDEKQIHIGKTILPIPVSNANQIIAFDFDYDFKNDLAIATDKGFRLFNQIEGENFEDVTANTGLSNEILQNTYAGVWTFDVESDGDLDLVLSDGTVLQNNSDGGFTKIIPLENVRDVVDFGSFDFDEDGDSDAVMVTSGKLKLFSNERAGLFRERVLPQMPVILAMNIGDINGDGSVDLITVADNSVKILTDRNNGTEVDFTELFQTDACESDDFSVGIPCSIQLADFDNNGGNDVLISSQTRDSLFVVGRDGSFSKSTVPVNAYIFDSSEMNSDGKIDLIGIDAEKKPTVFQNNSTKNYHWQILKPKAAKTEGDQRVNSFGIGGEMEIRSGLLAQKQLITSPQVHFGLGESESADVLRVVWGNGYVQAEFDLKADQTIAAEQRLKGSCPHLFAWNGSEFKLVKDAPPWSPALGLKINAQDTYGVLQTEEWFKIPGESLKPKDGFYELRITGEYWETFYLDSYKLLAVDHPAETEIFTDERFAIPLPPLKVFTTETAQRFASAKNDKGEDVSEIVLNLDEKYLDGIKRGKFQGVAEDHFVELELPENAPNDKKIWIVADGWVHPTDASINVQRGQIPGIKPPKSLSLEVLQENGEWKTEKENLGFPAGKMKTVLIDLPNGAKKFRLRSELEIFWDKLAWATDLPENQTREKTLEMSSAVLRYRGFSVIEKADDSSPEKPVYNKILTTNQRWRDLEGFYTRFGDVLELLKNTDDRFVLANAGDEVILKFPVLPDVEKGWKRDFVIVGNGWIKDGDLNSVFSKTVLPLPTHVSNDYSSSPTSLENDPVFQKNKADWLNFHTRYVAPNEFRNALR